MNPFIELYPVVHERGENGEDLMNTRGVSRSIATATGSNVNEGPPRPREEIYTTNACTSHDDERQNSQGDCNLPYPTFHHARIITVYRRTVHGFETILGTPEAKSQATGEYHKIRSARA